MAVVLVKSLEVYTFAFLNALVLGKKQFQLTFLTIRRHMITFLIAMACTNYYYCHDYYYCCMSFILSHRLKMVLQGACCILCSQARDNVLVHMYTYWPLT